LRHSKNKSQQFWLVLIGLVVTVFAWSFIDAPVSEKTVYGVVTQGVWKVQRHSSATFQGVARIENGTLVNFTTYQSLPVGTHIAFYQYRRPISGLTTYEYAGQ